MIQRIQSVFLFLLAVAMVLVAFSPIWEQVNPAQTQRMMLTAWSLKTIAIDSQEVLAEKSVFYIGGLALTSALLALFSLLQYKDRGRQLMLNMVNALLMMGTVISMVWQVHQANAIINPGVNGAFVLGFWAVFFALVMNMLANRFIRKDEKLVRSIDRIR